MVTLIATTYSSTIEGSQITFHCGGDSPVMTSTCRNWRWIPDPVDLDCGELLSKGKINSSIVCMLVDSIDWDCDVVYSSSQSQWWNAHVLETRFQWQVRCVITAVVCSFVFFILGMVVGALTTGLLWDVYTDWNNHQAIAPPLQLPQHQLYMKRYHVTYALELRVILNSKIILYMDL